MISRIVFLFSLITIVSSSLFADEPPELPIYPFIAEVTSEHVNVRAGQSANFEKIYKFKKGDEVSVLGSQYSWYKIQLPKDATVYISSEYLQLLTDEKGVVTGKRVNIRARAGINSSIVGQLTRGDEVDVVEVREGWYGIVAPENIYGWVQDKFLAFKSKKLREKKTKKIIQKASNKKPKVVQSSETTIAYGYLKPLSDSESSLIEGIDYRLASPAGLTLYYLDGPEDIFSDFLGFSVRVEGPVKTSITFNSPHAVISVQKIQLQL